MFFPSLWEESTRLKVGCSGEVGWMREDMLLHRGEWAPRQASCSDEHLFRLSDMISIG